MARVLIVLGLAILAAGQFRNPIVVRVAGYAYQRGFGGHFHNDNAIGALRDGMTPSHAMDIIRVVNTTEAYADLTTRRGWTVAEWKEWLTNLLSGLLRVPLHLRRRARQDR